MRKKPRVLLIPKTSYSTTFQKVSQILSSHRIKYRTSVAGKNLPEMIRISKGMANYAVIFFEDIRSYLEMDLWNRELLDKYCSHFEVGIIAFVRSSGDALEEDLFTSYTSGLNITIRSRRNLKDFYIETTSLIPRIAKSGSTLFGPIPEDSSIITFFPKDDASELYLAVAKANASITSDFEITILQDTGKSDNIPKVLFGNGLQHWLDKLLFLDSLYFLSHGKINISLNRYILVDIDDIFVGKNRLVESDVEHLLASQRRIRSMVPGFHYNLGFSGSYFHYSSGTESEKLGDDALIKYKDQFWWFPHMWQHTQPHIYSNYSEIIEQMKLNKLFAQEKKLPVAYRYSISPHHSGVYPIHEYLYDAWKEVWDIKVSSTEEYPHLRPAYNRRGFVHRGIKVLPRQTCGLFTRNLYYDEYPKGSKTLEDSIQGGELFQTIVSNPVSLFMTHMPNYGFDRLAPYLFESTFSLLKCWTNLQLQTLDPENLARIYFEDYFPEEKHPIWGSPCNDRRHMEIWSNVKSCKRLPNFLVIGPQKTGTTALYSFLKLHPFIKSNYPSKKTFEELQFFSSDDYFKGIDFYMSFFPFPNNGTFLFEKSATYFDHEVVPLRTFSLLPKAHLIAIIISPSQRAYSWYHHMRAHNDPTALNYTFEEVIRAHSVTSPKPLRKLQSRCLEPGKYSQHLERWLTFYNSQSLHIIDGEELKYDPVSVLNRLQHFLDIQPFYDYKDKIKYDRKKGFYCPLTSKGQVECLGKGKGRNYPPMKVSSVQYLKEYFRLDNEAAVKLLKRLGYAIPGWLEDDLKGLESVNPLINISILP